MDQQNDSHIGKLSLARVSWLKNTSSDSTRENSDFLNWKEVLKADGLSVRSLALL